MESGSEDFALLAKLEQQNAISFARGAFTLPASFPLCFPLPEGGSGDFPEFQFVCSPNMRLVK